MTEGVRTKVMPIIIAFSAGLLGNYAARFLDGGSVQAATPSPVSRAQRFELIDSAGAVRAALGVESSGRSHLQMFSNTGKVAVDIGVSGEPYLTLNGNDGLPRFTVKMAYGEKPLLTMGDGDSASKIQLGSIQQDVLNPNLDTWLLQFNAILPLRPMAVIGKAGMPDRGALFVRSAAGNSWFPPEGKP